jgi:hypothetical protein
MSETGNFNFSCCNNVHSGKRLHQGISFGGRLLDLNTVFELIQFLNYYGQSGSLSKYLSFLNFLYFSFPLVRMFSSLEENTSNSSTFVRML